jgi:hypothetical protein
MPLADFWVRRRYPPLAYQHPPPHTHTRTLPFQGVFTLTRHRTGVTAVGLGLWPPPAILQHSQHNATLHASSF